MKFLKELNIESFRGIINLKIKDIGKINILLGENNCGKTSILEAIMLLLNPGDPANIIKTAQIRDKNISYKYTLPDFDSFLYLFSKTDDLFEIKIRGKSDVSYKNQELLFNLKGDIHKELFTQDIYNDGGEIDIFNGTIFFIPTEKNSILFPATPIEKNFKYHQNIKNIKIETQSEVEFRYISPTDHVVGNVINDILKEKSLENDIVQLLKIFDTNINGLKLIESDDKKKVLQYIEHKKYGNMPVSVYGDGIKKVLTLANGLASVKNGVLLIDEIETAIHKSAMRKVFNWLIKACNLFNVQIFLTTHSIEVVDEILQNENNLKDIKVMTIVKKENETKVRNLSGEKALETRENYELELRQ